MNSTNDASILRTSLRRLGFSEGACLIYEQLLSGGKNVHELDGDLANPTRIRNDIRFLLQHGLVGKARGVGNYYAVDPSIAWQATIADLIWTQEVSLASVWGLPPSRNSTVEAARDTLEGIRRASTNLYVPQSDLPGSGREFVISHPKKVEQTMVEAISTSQTHIWAASRSPRWPNVAPMWAAITARMAEQVSYLRVADLNELADHGISIVRRDIEETGVQLRFIENHVLDCSFYLIDGKLLAVRRDGSNSVTVSSRPSTVKQFAKRHRSWWDSAVPAILVLSQFEIRAQRLLERAEDQFGPDGRTFLLLLIQYGRFALHHETLGWPRSKVVTLRNRCLDANLVEWSLMGFLVPSYGIRDSDLTRIRSGESLN